MKGKGCSNCNKSGYRGRMGIYELMIMTSTIRELAFKGEPTQAIRKVARKQGMRTLFEDGMIKALKGLTTLDEVLRITQQDVGDRAPADDREGGRRGRVPRRADPSGRVRAASHRTRSLSIVGPQAEIGPALKAASGRRNRTAGAHPLDSMRRHRDNRAVGRVTGALP